MEIVIKHLDSAHWHMGEWYPFDDTVNISSSCMSKMQDRLSCLLLFINAMSDQTLQLHPFLVECPKMITFIQQNEPNHSKWQSLCWKKMKKVLHFSKSAYGILLYCLLVAQISCDRRQIPFAIVCFIFPQSISNNNS